MRSVACLLAQTLQLRGIIVVDNGSPGRIGEVIARRFGEAVTVLRLAENQGPAGGFAAGMRAALERAADWIWLVDDDSWPLPDALQVLAACPHFSAPQTAALSSLKYDPDGRLQKWEAIAQGRNLHLPDEAAYGRSVFAVDAAAFAGLLVCGEAAARADVPDARYFSWFADFEFCLRLRARGRIYCVPGSRLVHEDDGSRATRLVCGQVRPTVPLFLRQCIGLRNRAYYHSGRHGLPSAVAHAAYRFGRMAGGILLWDDDKSFRLRTLFRAFSDGLRGRLGPFPRNRRQAGVPAGVLVPRP